MKRREFIKSVAAVTALGWQGGLVGAEPPNDGRATGASGLPQRLLGKTGVKVGALALGGVIGMMKPPSEDHDPVALAETALNLGITYFDTAPAYNRGQSESNYGQVLARRRKEVFLATKTGDRTRDGTLRSIEASLKRLRTDRVDLLQIHGVSENEDLDAWDKPNGVLRALHELREQKVVRFLGVTGHASSEKLLEAITRYEFDTLLTTLNPVERRRPYREKLLPAALAKGMGVIAMKVMGGGNGCLVKGNPFRQVLRPYHDQTHHQVEPGRLIRYTLGLPVSVAVIGVAGLDQLKRNVQVVRTQPPMNSAERVQLEQLMG